MTRLFSAFIIIAFFLAFCPASPFCQEGDITGTWIGSTQVPDQGTDELTLVIEKEDSEYTATISDSLGMVQDTECEDLEYEEGSLTFNFTIYDVYESMTVWITLDVDGDKMSGYWETQDGSQGEIELEKQ